MSERAPRASKAKEYPPKKLSWIEASHLVQEFALSNRLDQRLKTALELVDEAERDTKEAVRRAKQAARLSRKSKKGGKAVDLVPKMDWYLKELAGERKRLTALIDVVVGFEKGTVPEDRNSIGEFVSGTRAERKVKNIKAKGELAEGLKELPEKNEEGKKLVKPTEQYLRDRLQGMLENLNKAVDYKDPAGFMDSPLRQQQKQKAQQEQWAAMVQTEIQMDTKEAETPVLDNDSSPGENEEEERVEETTLPEEPVVTLTQESRLRVVDSFSAILEGPPGDHTALEETVRTMIDRFYKGAVSKEYAYLTVLDYVRSLYPRHPLSEEEIDAITAEAMGYMNNLAANAAARSLPGYSNIPALPDPVIDLFNESVFRVKDAYHILKPKKLVLPGISKPLVFAAAFIAATFAGAGTAGQTRGMQRIPGAIPFSQLEQEARNTPADMSNPPPQAPTGYAGRAVPADAPPPQTP